MNKLIKLLILVIGLFHATVMARTYPMPKHPDSRLVGELQWHEVQPGDSIYSISKHYRIGILAITAANNHMDPTMIRPGMKLLIPSQFLLPDAPKKGVVVNLAELRLYYYHPDGRSVDVFPVGIGRVGWNTPEMRATLTHKHLHPVWRPTKNIKAEYASKGEILPDVVPAGPDNPLGNHALRLNGGPYLIHGTNKDFGIGLRVSSGCIRMFPEDIEFLFEQLPVGTPITIVDQPVKQSVEPGQEMIFEVHEPLSRSEEEMGQATKLELSKSNLKFITQEGVDEQKVRLLLKKQAGVPMNIALPESDMLVDELFNN